MYPSLIQPLGSSRGEAANLNRPALALPRIRRRDFLIGLMTCGIVAGRVRALPSTRGRRIAVVHLSERESAGPPWHAFIAELRQRGYAVGQNLLIDRHVGEEHSWEGRPDKIAEIVARAPEVLVVTSSFWARRARIITSTIPIVALTSNPADEGLVSSLARPSGNITGLSTDAGPALLGKRLDLLLRAAPDCSHVACLGAGASTNPDMRAFWRDARSRGVTAQEFLVHRQFSALREEARYVAAFAAMVRDGANAVLVFGDAEHLPHASGIAALALKYRMPLISPFRQLTEAGGLMSYGADWIDLERRRAAYVARILDGVRPEDLPFEQPAQFEFVVNLKTAQALGRPLPTSLVSLADDLIE